jgi:cytochrome P450
MTTHDIHMDSRDFQLDPWSVYKKLRKHTPVFWSEENNCYFISKFKVIRHILMDSDSFGVEHPFRTTRHLFGPTIIDMDGNAHQRIRAAISRTFKPANIHTLVDTVIQPVVKECVMQLKGKESVEIMSEFAVHIPTLIILKLIGLPVKDGIWVYENLRPIMQFLDYPKKGLSEAIKASDQLYEYIEEFIQNCNTIDPNSLLADLLAPPQSEQISTVELIRHVLLLLSAGTETTIGTIGNIFTCILKNREILRVVQTDSSIIPLLIQETLRYEPPLHVTTRIAKKDVDLDGVRIPKGAFLQLLLASANRDEEMFEQPNVWNIYRKEKVNLSFGSGSHNCPGYALAYMELEVILTQFFEHFLIKEPTNEEIPIIEGKSFRCPQQVIVRLIPRA